jgi:hypothetical protein
MARQPSLLLLDDAFVTFRLRLHIIWLLFMWLGGVDTKREREKFTDDFPRNTFEDKFKGQYSKSCCRSSFRFDLSLVPFILPSIEPDAATIYPHSLSLLLSLSRLQTVSSFRAWQAVVCRLRVDIWNNALLISVYIFLRLGLTLKSEWMAERLAPLPAVQVAQVRSPVPDGPTNIV